MDDFEKFRKIIRDSGQKATPEILLDSAVRFCHQAMDFPGSMNESCLLAQKAREEFLLEGSVRVICPKCKTTPIVKTSGHNCERLIIRCECGYVAEIEFVF